MKTLKTLLAAIFFLTFSISAFGQDFIVSGYVTVSPANLAKVGHPVIISADSFNNPIGQRYVSTVFTNSNGYYTDTIPGGGATGPNQTFFVLTLDSCQNVYLRDTVENLQGTVQQARVDFSMDCGSNVNTCPVGFQSFITGALGGMKFSPSPIDSGYYYHWDFGDGNSSSLISPEYFYTNTGTYYACLTVETYLGCTSTFCDSVYVTSVVDTCGNNAAYAQFSQQVAGYNVSFTTAPATPPGSLVYMWDFGDGYSSNDPSPSHTYAPNPNNPAQTSYNVCLTTFYNNTGTFCFDRVCQTVTVPDSNSNNSPCDAEWIANRTGSGSYSFTSLYGSNNATYFWDLGDGATSSDPFPSHTYNQSGYYEVCLTLSQAGCTNTYCDSIYVIGGNNLCVDPRVIDTINYFCNTAIDPVCGCDGNTYNNSCEAYYWYGVTSWTAGPCGSSNQLSLSGLVTKGLNQVAQSAIVYLISADSAANDVVLSLVDSQYTSPQGYYSFNNIPAGTYYLKAALTPNDADYAGFLPTYYDISLFWGYATAVYNSSNNLNIALVAGNNTGGPGFVSGNISQGAGKVAGGDAVVNVPILLLDMNDNAVQYTYSDANGDFELDDIAYGTYQLYAEVLDKETEPAIITISADNESVESVELLVGSEKVISGTNDIIYELKNWKIYPNPANRQTVLEYGLNTSAEIQIGITDLLGKELSRLYYGVQNAGTQRMEIDLSGLESGVYFINLFADGQRIKASTLFKE